MKTEPFVIERIYHAPAQKVWEAITNRDKMEQWYFKLEAFKPEVGFEFRFTGGTKEKTYLHICTITEIIPGKKLMHTWQYDGYEGQTFVTWEVFDEGDKTRVRLTHAGLDTLPNDPGFARENFEKGWTHILATSLKDYLEKN